jgi:hypothetical protein
VQAILGAQQRLRDRFLFALRFETEMRVGQALGLRHEDVVSWERRIEIRSRDDNANGARGKGGRAAAGCRWTRCRVRSGVSEAFRLGWCMRR